MSKFHLIDRDTDFLLPPSVQEWLTPGHLSLYEVEVVESLDLSSLEQAYSGEGQCRLLSGRPVVIADLWLGDRHLLQP